MPHASRGELWFAQRSFPARVRTVRPRALHVHSPINIPTVRGGCAMPSASCSDSAARCSFSRSYGTPKATGASNPICTLYRRPNRR